jgi:hypothetical protein
LSRRFMHPTALSILWYSYYDAWYLQSVPNRIPWKTMPALLSGVDLVDSSTAVYSDTFQHTQLLSPPMLNQLDNKQSLHHQIPIFVM